MASTDAKDPPLSRTEFKELRERWVKLGELLSEQRLLLNSLNIKEIQMRILLLQTNDPTIYNTTLDTLRSIAWDMSDPKNKIDALERESDAIIAIITADQLAYPTWRERLDWEKQRQ